VPAVCGRDVTMARRPNPAKIEPVVTSKCTSGRPLLTGSALPIEFPVTPSKQRKRKFLTGARTHISIFNFCPFSTQNPAQLIQRHRGDPYKIPATVPPENSTGSLFLSRRFTRASLLFNARSVSDNRHRDRISNRNCPANKICRKQTLKALLTETGTTHIASRTSTSNRFWTKNRSSRKQNIKPILPGATTAQNDSRVSRFFSPASAPRASGLKVQPLPRSTHRTPSGIMPRRCLQAPKEPSALA